MLERRLLQQDWVTKLKAAQIKAEQLRNDFPQNHEEQAMRDIYQKYISGKSTEDFVYMDAKAVFEAITTQTEEGR